MGTIDSHGEEDDATDVDSIDHSVSDVDDCFAPTTMTTLQNNDAHLPQALWEEHAHRPAYRLHSSSNGSGHFRWHLTWQRSLRNSAQVGQLPPDDTPQKNTSTKRRSHTISYTHRSQPVVAAMDIFNAELLLGSKTTKNTAREPSPASRSLLRSPASNAKNIPSRPSPMRADVRTIFMDSSSPSLSSSNCDNSMTMPSCCIQNEDKEWLVQMESFDDLVLSTDICLA
jgi:hypothetical protein